MKIDLSEKMDDHFARVEKLAEEAAGDEEATFSARASAMTAMTAVIKELTKEQEKIHNMSSIQELQSAIVEALEEYSPELKDEVLKILERRLCNA